MRVNLTNAQLNKLKSAAKNKTGTILRVNKKNFQDKELPPELFLTTRQTTKIRNVFANNISTDIKLSKAQISKIIHWGRSFGSWLDNLGKKAQIVWDKNKRRRRCQSRKRIYFIILNKNMNDIIKITKSLEDSNLLIDGIAETVKHEVKKQQGGFLRASLVHPVTSSLVKDISGRGVRRAGIGYIDKIF